MVLTHRYDSRTDCTCDGVYPVPPAATPESILQQNEFSVVKRMVDMANLVNSKENEWNPRDLFTTDDLHTAIAKFLLLNADE